LRVTASNNAATSGTRFYIGGGTGYYVASGYFAEIRIVKGNPVYTSNFTVMNTAFIS